MAASDLGSFCATVGLSEVNLLNNTLPQLSESSKLSNGLLYELSQFRKMISWTTFKGWIEHVWYFLALCCIWRSKLKNVNGKAN